MTFRPPLVTRLWTKNERNIAVRSQGEVFYDLALFYAIPPFAEPFAEAPYRVDFEIATAVQIQGLFLRTLRNVYFDPSEINLFILAPNGELTANIYPAGAIVRGGIGQYGYTFVPYISGIWRYKWQAKGAHAVTSPDMSFIVNPSVLIAG